MNNQSRNNFIRNASLGLGAAGGMFELGRQEAEAIEIVYRHKKKPAVTKTSSNSNGVSVIFIHARGGMSQVDSWNIKEGNKDAIRNSEPIKTSADGIRVGKYFPNIAKHMDKASIINTMSNTQGIHTFASYLMKTSYEKRGTVLHPHFGCWTGYLDTSYKKDIPPFVTIGEGRGRAGFLGSTYDPLPIVSPANGISNITSYEDLSKAQFNSRYELLKKVNSRFRDKVDQAQIDAYNHVYESAMRLMESPDLTTFDLTKEKNTTREMYGQNNFGQGCLLARRLVEKGVRFIEITYGKWDHHHDLYNYFGEMAAPYDQGVGALMTDLRERGLLDNTLVVLSTEFGRSAKLGDGGGRGHGPAVYSTVLLGAGVKHGVTYGKTDEMGGKILSNKVKVPDLNATIGTIMGLDLEHEITTNAGRPFTMTGNGKPISAILSNPKAS